MKLYKFAISNWKSGSAKSFWYYKAFPSAYLADRWATKITFQLKGSPYMVIGYYGEEEIVC